MKSKNVLGLLAGVATGALIGVLFAPERGSKTRDKIRTKSLEAKDALRDEFDNFLDTVTNKYGELVKKGEQAIRSTKEQAINKGEDVLKKGEYALEKEKMKVKNEVNSTI